MPKTRKWNQSFTIKEIEISIATSQPKFSFVRKPEENHSGKTNISTNIYKESHKLYFLVH